jgi:trimeric autotransporter adhesin
VKPQLSLVTLALFLIGCGTSLKQASITPSPQAKKQGLVHGGQQPVTGATVQLYAVGTTGDGSAATQLLSTTTDADGDFSLTGLTCPSPTAPVYYLATGGNPGLSPGTNNPNLALMAAVGPCGSLTTSSFTVINELTTVAAVYALAPFIASPTSIGSFPADSSNLAAAFTLAFQYVNINTGSAPGTNVPAGSTVPVAELNTLCDILAVCVNSAGGTAGDNTACGNLFSLTAIGPAVTDTITSTLNLANYPSELNTQSLFNLVLAAAPFQPTLSIAPLNFSVGFVVPATLSLSSSEITFPTTVVGFQAMQTLTLTNIGPQSVVITTINVNGSDFVQSNDCPVNLATSSSCSIQVTFTPTALGTRSANLSIISNASNPQIIIPVGGDGSIGTTAGPITVSPSQLNFTLVNVPQNVTITNLGSSPIALGPIPAMLGRNDTFGGVGFTLSNSCGSTLQPQSICTVSVSAASLYTSISGTLNIYNDTATSPLTVPLHTTSSVSLTQSSFSFGEWALGVTTSLGIYVSKTSDNLVNFESSGSTGPNASDFFLSPTSCQAYPACTVPIYFKPSGVGLRTATLTTNLGNILVSGSGVPTGPGFRYAWQNGPAFYQTINTAGPVNTINLTNNGSTSLQLVASVAGSNSADFAIGNQCPSSVAPAATCAMAVSYNPTRLGTFSDALTFTDSISGIQQTVSFFSSSFLPPPVATPSSLIFGNVQVGATGAEQTFTVTAPIGDHVVSTVLQDGTPGFTITQGSTCAGTPCTVSVVMTPPSTNCCSTNLLVTDTVTGQVAFVTLNGTAGVPTVSFSPSSPSFAPRSVGSTSIAQTVTLTNSGNANLAITGISVSGANPADFIQSNNCGSTIFPNGSCTFTISFSPTASGSRAAYIQVLSNTTSSPDLIQLTGIAE